MSQRSPYNDRYKVEGKGKTRKSASAAKPKRAVAETGTAAKKKTSKSTAWSRAKSSAQSRQRATAPEPVATPRMKQLRRYWWIAWIAALAVAVIILGLQSLGGSWVNFVPVGWGVWLVSMGIAFYLEFVPIRKERAAMVEAARAPKSGKAAKAEKAAAKAGTASTPPKADNADLGLPSDDEGDDE